MSIHDHFKSVSTGASNYNKGEELLIHDSEVNTLRWHVLPVKMTKTTKSTMNNPHFTKDHLLRGRTECQTKAVMGLRRNAN